jgi:F-box and leucine-rich repeat protein 2/20
MVSSFHSAANLQILKLEGCKFMADGLSSIGRCCGSIRELSVSKFSGVIDAELLLLCQD